ncbi:hypothetical protein EH243_13385 [Amphritea opalescens]|uniref:O-antigen ligase domain-containing protein n=1 Tax=Amphritea opalescens TaxID=2490544 RepID=A0A430KP30_9GAMM|nr:hypothetical protein [Amphritea opalescens]RTE65230.1 hypothetical protein EH243_13385 [Amphritea opalescens]
MILKKTNVLIVILFLLGFSQFFVKIEPGPAEFLLLFLVPYVKYKALIHPATIGLFVGNVIALFLEVSIFDSMLWSLTSLYLTLLFVVVLSCIYRIGYDAYSSIIIGGCFGCVITLLILLTTNSPDLYRYGIRFTGYFKDPNVAAPTAVFFGVAALLLKGRLKILAVFPLLIFLIAMSRASYIALICAIIMTLSLGHPVRFYFSGLIVSVLLIMKDYLMTLANIIFSSIGRGAIFNSYDSDRASNWNILISSWSNKILPLAPTYSEKNGYAAHSTPLRLLVEQGMISTILFFIVCFIAVRSTQPKLLLLALLTVMINGIVVDATHWRVLFIVLALSIGAAYMTFKDSVMGGTYNNRKL